MLRWLRGLARCWGMLGVAAVACGETGSPAADSGTHLPPPSDASIVVVLPDTQFYACAYPGIFRAQTEWIASQQAAAENIAVVLHTGDIVDSDSRDQWGVAADSMGELHSAVPYLVTSGNHDQSPGRATLMPSYFPPSELAMFAGEAGSYEPQRRDNSYAVVQIAGRPWLILGLEFAPRDAVVAWADAILDRHAALPAILFTHAYLYSDGQRYDRRVMPLQPYHPDAYGVTPDQGVNDGEDLWQRLVEPHANIRLVLSGHVIPVGTAHSSATRSDGSVVHQVLANYQRCDLCPCAEVEGGGGYLRLLEFSEAKISVSTYSPHRSGWLTDLQNAFDLPL